MITDARLEQLRTQALFMSTHGLPSRREAWDGVAEALRELIQRRRGEFICPQCQIRQDSLKQAVEF